MIVRHDELNASCACITLDPERLDRELDALVGEVGFGQRLRESHPTLLSSTPVFLAPTHLARMASVIAAIEQVASLPEYQFEALRSSPLAASHRPAARSVLMGYDFHLHPDGPKLIEINTNAGGGLVNALLAEAQKACCLTVEPLLALARSHENHIDLILRSFIDEWRLERGNAKLSTIAIVDTAPEQQYLYPEFVLFQGMFRRAGFEAVIAAPESLDHADGQLRFGGTVVDLVYNRLTDFALEAPESAALRSAYEAGHVVVTPHPRAHALLADKCNLARLTDPALLRSWGVDEDVIAVLAQGIPRTVDVSAANADELWSHRNRLFFKPTSGFGGRAAYRGDKLTRRVWDMIRAGDYVAQELIPPTTRRVDIDGQPQNLKIDIRNYCYDGRVQLVAARLYQGQTTNMRTPGGGFTPVLQTPQSLPDVAALVSGALRCGC